MHVTCGRPRWAVLPQAVESDDCEHADGVFKQEVSRNLVKDVYSEDVSQVSTTVVISLSV